MATLRTVTVKSAGGDYSSLSSAEAGEQGNLVTLDRQLDIECYSMSDTTAVTIDGWTTDATRYIRVFTPAAERHAGVWHVGKYNLVRSTDFGQALSCKENFVRCEGLQVGVSSTTVNAGTAVSMFDGGAGDNRIDHCIVMNRGTGANSIGIMVNSGQNSIRNSVCYTAAQPAVLVQNLFSAPTLAVDNCTLKGGTYGVSRSAGTVTLQNVYAHGGTDAYTGTMTLTTCAHSSASVFTGSTASIAHSTANFVNVTATTEDYHLASGASATLLSGGTDLSGTFTTDIDGQTRTVPYSIGADQIIAAGGVGIPICMYHYVHHICGCSK